MSHLLDVHNLSTAYTIDGGRRKILARVSLFIDQGEKVGIIGESGSGKTTLSDAILNILPFKKGVILEGAVQYKGEDLLTQSQKIIGKEIAYIPQDPASSLDPLFPIVTNFKELIKAHQGRISKREFKRVIDHMLHKVHLSRTIVNVESYPHQLSGGMQQRILIALALLSNPALIIADEPTSNLDVTTEHAIIKLFDEIRRARKVAFLLTTHNLLLAQHFCDRIYVFFMGNIVEVAATAELFSKPQHPYTKALMNALPRVTEKREIKSVAGGVANYADPSGDCCFRVKCAEADEVCMSVPVYKQISETHYVQCWKVL